MTDTPSADPNRFGPHSSGLRMFLDEVLELSDEQLDTVAARHRGLSKEDAHDFAARLARVPLTESSAVDKASRATYHQIKGRLRAVGGRLASLSGDMALSLVARAVAFPEKLDEEQFDLAVAPFVAVGIDCRALSRMGLVEE